MLTKFDDYLLNQTETTTDHVQENDPRWHERYWFNIHDIPRQVVISQGLGVYPNSNLIDGFAGVVYNGTQYNFRASRALNHERMDTFIGPLSVKVAKGLRTIKIALAENASEISYELTLEAATPAYNRVPMEFIRGEGRFLQNSAMFTQCGRVSGWVKVGDKTFKANPDKWWYAKSNCWGIRSQIGGPDTPAQAPRGANGVAYWSPASVFISAQFRDRYMCITDNTGEIIYKHDDPRGRVKIIDASHQIKFTPGTISPKSVRSTLMDENCKKYVITTRPWATFYLKGKNWGAYRDYFDGLYRGEAYHSDAGCVETDKFELSNPQVVKDIAGRDDHVSEFRIGEEIGYGVFETGVRGEEPYAPYEPEE